MVTVSGEPWLVDVGFGGNGLLEPMPLEAGAEVTQHSEAFKLLPADGGEYLLQCRVHGEWESLYSFTTDPCQPIDYKYPNYFHSHSPDSIFMQRRICNSEEHFAAKCPNKGSGKGAGPPSGFFQHAPSAPSGSGSHWAEPAAADSPWANSDLEMRWFAQPTQSAYEETTSRWGAHMASREPDDVDPWLGHEDPWSAARMNLRPLEPHSSTLPD